MGAHTFVLTYTFIWFTTVSPLLKKKNVKEMKAMKGDLNNKINDNKRV